MAVKRRIPAATVARLSVYARVLEELDRKTVELVSSAELGRRSGCAGAQIRKDLSFFGGFGKTGKGYYVRELKEAISRILGLDRDWEVALVGAGHLGSALLAFPGFRERGFSIAAVFDNDRRKIGSRLEDVIIQDVADLPATAKKKDIRIGIIAVPPAAAQEIADVLTASGVKAILNFAPARITVPEGVVLRNADLSTDMECLSYFLARTERG